MKDNFQPALAHVLAHEGGYVNDPRDPGGATNHGITQRVYDAYRKQHGLPQEEVASITDIEVEAIYHANYWYPICADDLPAGLDYATFDYAVNSGCSRAARSLQLIVGAAPDGKIGPVTLAMINSKPSADLIRDLCYSRLQFLQGLPTFGHFGRGWTARVNEVQAQAEAMAS
jgi:lysozyme family protein